MQAFLPIILTEQQDLLRGLIRLLNHGLWHNSVEVVVDFVVHLKRRIAIQINQITQVELILFVLAFYG